MSTLASISTAGLECCMSESDTDLMERLRDDDHAEEALCVLIERYQNELVGFFYNHCWDQLIAEDLAQTVFIKIFQARQRYRVQAKLRTWIYRIAHNAWIDHVRKAARKRTQSLDVPIGDRGLRMVDTLAASQRLSERENDTLRARIEAAVQALPEGQRAVFVMANNQGLKYQEIGAILDIPEGTVKSRMHGAVRRLRDALQDLVE